MAGTEHAFEDLREYRLEPADEEALLLEQTECTFIWANREGWPVGVIMAYLWRDGRFWLTAAAGRARVKAVRRDPRVSVCVSSIGTTQGMQRTVTYKGMCKVLDDAETKAWFYPALAAALIPGDQRFQQGFARFLDSPDRVVLEVEPGQRIDHDGVKMLKATLAWIAEEEAAGAG
ncbi:MAG: pyridoxamine 5'-phosphate oxidase family protein [Acidimicrobiia bacterium]